MRHYPTEFFFVDSKSPCKDLIFPRRPNLEQKPLNLVGTVLKFLQFEERFRKAPFSWRISVEPWK